MELRRLKQDLITIFKIINNILNVNFSEFFEFNTYGTTRGHSLKLVKPNSKNNAREFSFACRRVSCWNSLPDCAVNAQTIGMFKCSINSVDFSKLLIFLNFFT